MVRLSVAARPKAHSVTPCLTLDALTDLRFTPSRMVQEPTVYSVHHRKGDIS